jgi:hypothetical protein
VCGLLYAKAFLTAGVDGKDLDAILHRAKQHRVGVESDGYYFTCLRERLQVLHTHCYYHMGNFSDANVFAKWRENEQKKISDLFKQCGVAAPPLPPQPRAAMAHLPTRTKCTASLRFF